MAVSHFTTAMQIMGLKTDRIGYNNNVSPNIEPIINTLDAMIRRIVEKETYKKKCEHVIRFLWTRTAHHNLEEGWLLCDSPSFTTSSFCQLCHHNQLKLNSEASSKLPVPGRVVFCRKYLQDRSLRSRKAGHPPLWGVCKEPFSLRSISPSFNCHNNTATA